MIKKYMNLYDYIEKYNFKNINILNDALAWVNYPDYNFVYNKLWVAQSQNLSCGPMNVYPKKYPIVFKPIINLYGMSRGFKIINNEEEYNNNIRDGFFWEEYLEGYHFCLDLIIVKGEIKFFSTIKSISGEKGTFLYHESILDYEIPPHIKYWIKHFMEDYTGAMNLEIINGLIIEVHLRLNGDFHLYNKNFVTNLDNLYEKGIWKLKNFKIKKKYLIPIFVSKDITQDKLILIKDKIIELSNKFKINSLMEDDINSNEQSEYLSRAFMIDVSCHHNEIINSLN